MNNELKFIIKPVLLLTILIILFTAVFFIGVKKITTIKAQINDSKKMEAVLGQKVSILETIPNIILGDTTFLDIALPSRGAVLYGLNQVKSQAVLNGVIITNLKTGSVSPEKDAISKVNITFDVSGPSENLYTFLSSFSKLLPLMNVDRARISTIDSTVNANVTINVYTAELPKKIQSITENAEELTDDDIETIKTISNYTIPEFIEPKPFEGEAKPDPFN